MKKIAYLLGAVLLWVCTSTAARADSITFVLTDQNQTVYIPPGIGAATAVVPFTATVTASAANTSNIYINGYTDFGNPSGSIYNGPTNPFTTNFIGLSLAPGQNFTAQAFILLGKYIPGETLPATVSDAVSITGGSTRTSFNTLATVTPTATLQIAPAPEPSTWMLMATGLVLMLAFKGRAWEVGRNNSAGAVAG